MPLCGIFLIFFNALVMNCIFLSWRCVLSHDLLSFEFWSQTYSHPIFWYGLTIKKDCLFPVCSCEALLEMGYPGIFPKKFWGQFSVKLPVTLFCLIGLASPLCFLFSHTIFRELSLIPDFLNNTLILPVLFLACSVVQLQLLPCMRSHKLCDHF